MKAHICKPKIQVPINMGFTMGNGALFVGEPCEKNLLATTDGDMKMSIAIPDEYIVRYKEVHLPEMKPNELLEAIQKYD